MDASAFVDALRGDALGLAIRRRLRDSALHAPAHIDAEVLSALGRLHRAGEASADEVSIHIDEVADAAIERHSLAPVLAGAWSRRENLRLADALYVELAVQLGVPLVTTDARLAAATDVAELVSTG